MNLSGYKIKIVTNTEWLQVMFNPGYTVNTVNTVSIQIQGDCIPHAGE